MPSERLAYLLGLALVALLGLIGAYAALGGLGPPAPGASRFRQLRVADLSYTICQRCERDSRTLVLASELHELSYAGGALYVTNLPLSTLFKLTFDPETGLLAAVERTWTFRDNGTAVIEEGGDPGRTLEHSSGLHHVGASRSHPDALWISEQMGNSISLVRRSASGGLVRVLRMQVPTRGLSRVGGGQLQLPLSGPHAVLEADDGTLLVALKGPYYVGLTALATATNAARGAKAEAAAARGVPYGGHVMSGYAVWRVHPDEYDASLPAHGGELIDAPEAPVMSAIGGDGDSYHVIDSSPVVLRVRRSDGRASRASRLPLPAGFRMSGPGIVATPDGSVWVCSLLHPNATLLRFRRGATAPERFEGFHPALRPARGAPRFVIHLAYSSRGGDRGDANVLYALTSSLVHPEATEEVLAYEFDAAWERGVERGRVRHAPRLEAATAQHGGASHFRRRCAHAEIALRDRPRHADGLSTAWRLLLSALTTVHCPLAVEV